MSRRTLALLLLTGALAACSTQGFRDPRTVSHEVNPATGELYEQHALQVTPGNEVSAETGIGAGALLILGHPVSALGLPGEVFNNKQAAMLYLLYDPLAPNWTIKERKLDANTYHLSLQAKRYRVGGDGEAMRILKRRADFLKREQGYADYRILDYSEGIESSTPWTHRFGEGTIQLISSLNGPKP